MAAAFPYRPVPITPGSLWEKAADRTIKSLLAGKLNAIGEITLTPSASSTTLTDVRLTAFSFLWFMPQSQNAANALTTIYVPRTTQKNGEAVINHASDAATDKTFTYLIIG